jgi:hypothetical protein
MSDEAEETPLIRAKAWLITAGSTLAGYEQLLAEGDEDGARAAFKAFRESLRTSEDCAFEAHP